MPHQRANILLAFPQWREVDRDDVQTIVQVLAEPALRDHRHQVAVGRRDNAHVDADFLPSAHTPDPAGLKCSQQASLRFRRHVPDLVEEQGAAVRLLELADLLRNRAREGTALMTKQLAFEQVMRDSGHVNCHEWAGPARAELVDGFGHQFLSRTAFAGHEDRQVVAQDPGDHPVDVLHGAAAADQGKRPLPLAAIVCFGLGRPTDGLTYRLRQFVEIEGLGEILEGLAIAGPYCGIECVLS